MAERPEGVVQEINTLTGQSIATPREKPKKQNLQQNLQAPQGVNPGVAVTLVINTEQVDLIPVLQLPEGLDISNEADPTTVAALKTAQDIIGGISAGTLGGVLLPFGWVISMLPVPKICEDKEDPTWPDDLATITAGLEDSDV